MPPQSPSLARHIKIIHITIPGFNRALRYISRSISPTITILFQSMPVDGNVVLCMISNIDTNSVSFSGINGRPWEHPINSHNRFCMAQPTHITLLNLKLVGLNGSFSCRKTNNKTQKREEHAPSDTFHHF
nr:hypothetical protein Iba_chr05cCG3740 [Ipomoea batatas]